MRPECLPQHGGRVFGAVEPERPPPPVGRVLRHPGWDRIRRLVACGRLPDPSVAPEDAAWFEEGSFSRWALADRPSLPSLLREVAVVVGFAEARQCAGVLADMGLDVSPSTLPSRRERRRRRAG